MFFGLTGAGIAFFGSYLFHGLIIYPIVRRLSGFRWSAANRLTGLLFLALISIVFFGFYILSPLPAAGIGTLALILGGFYSIRVLFNLIPLDRIPPPIQSLLKRFGLASSGSKQ